MKNKKGDTNIISIIIILVAIICIAIVFRNEILQIISIF